MLLGRHQCHIVAVSAPSAWSPGEADRGADGGALPLPVPLIYGTPPNPPPAGMAELTTIVGWCMGREAMEQAGPECQRFEVGVHAAAF